MPTALPFEPSSVRTSANGIISLWSRPPIAYTRVKGHFPREHAGHLIKLVDSVVAAGSSVEQFHDWGDMTSYDMSSQTDLTMWTVKIRRNVRALTILVHSPLVIAGVRMANSMLKGMIHVCQDRQEFEQILVARLNRAA
jgi:hypothetical protein